MCGTVDRIDCVIRSRNLTRQAVAVKSFITSAVKTCIAIHVVRKGKKKKRKYDIIGFSKLPFYFRYVTLISYGDILIPTSRSSCIILL